MLELQALHCGYGAMEAVHGIDLAARRGRMTALLGPNGAGKTSTMMAIVGQVQSFGGRIVLDGEDITALAPVERTRRGVAIAPEGRRLFPDLTVQENLAVGGYTRTLAQARSSCERVYALFPRLAERRQQRAGLMSGGEQQMLAVGMALMTKPKALLLDEPSAGLAPAAATSILASLRAINEHLATTIIMVEQNVVTALDVVERALVLRAGQIVFDGQSGELGRKEDLWSWF